MDINFNLRNIVAYGTTKADVLLGEKFSISVEDDDPRGFEAFANNDPVLSYSQDDQNNIICEATGVGPCKIQLQRDGIILQTIEINVFSLAAIDLGVSAGEPELKK